MAIFRKKKKSGDKPEEIPMTPMIDCVFQLLIYFLVTFETPDIFAHLDVYRPAPDAPPKEEQEKPDMLEINIYPEETYTINGRAVRFGQLAGYVEKLAPLNLKQTVIITCAADSSHKSLVDVLNLCAKNQLRNLSVVSGN